LRDTIDRHWKLRTAQVRVRVGDPDIAAEIILCTVEMNTHKFMAAPRDIPVETFESELVAMVTRYLRRDP
jgi:hypothetical protein